MALDQPDKGLLQLRFVDCPFNFQHHRHIVARLSGIELLRNIHPLLSGGSRIGLLFRSGQERLVIALLRRPDACRHLPQHRVLEHLMQRQTDSELLMDFGGQHHRFQRVPPELKKMIVRSKPLCSQHFAPYFRKRRLRVTRQRNTRSLNRPPRFGKSVAIHLSVRGQRKRLYHLKRCRNHIFGQAVLQCLPPALYPFMSVRLRVLFGDRNAALRHDIGAQAVMALLIPPRND